MSEETKQPTGEEVEEAQTVSEQETAEAAAPERRRAGTGWRNSPGPIIPGPGRCAAGRLRTA